MWERFVLKRGFRNVIRGGKTTGFQFKITIPYYRGLWISASFQGFAVRVDGASYPKDKISLKVGDKTYRLLDVDNYYDDFWYYGEPCTVIVEKEGGLADGLHKVECGIFYQNSYGTKEPPPPGYDFQWAGGFGGGYGSGNTETAASQDPFAGLRTCAMDLVLVI